MRCKVELTASAWEELDLIAEIHLSLAGVRSAEKITDRILDAIELLADNPYLGAEPKYPPIAEQGFRMLICGNYLCFYKVMADAVRVFHIADGRKDYPNLFRYM